jgi:hypothetical protein
MQFLRFCASLSANSWNCDNSPNALTDLLNRFHILPVTFHQLHRHRVAVPAEGISSTYFWIRYSSCRNTLSACSKESAQYFGEEVADDVEELLLIDCVKAALDVHTSKIQLHLSTHRSPIPNKGHYFDVEIVVSKDRCSKERRISALSDSQYQCTGCYEDVPSRS